MTVSPWLPRMLDNGINSPDKNMDKKKIAIPNPWAPMVLFVTETMNSPITMERIMM